MKRIVLALLIASSASVARAEHHGPVGEFAGQKPEEVSAKIAAVCEAGGFAVRRYSPTDLSCQGSDFAGGTDQFKNGGAVDDPASRPQAYHRFVADPSPTGTVVHERSQLVMTIGNGQLHAIDAIGLSAVKFNARVRSLYAAVQSLKITVPAASAGGSTRQVIPPEAGASPQTAELPMPAAASVQPTPTVQAAVAGTPKAKASPAPASACVRVLTDQSQSNC